MLSTCGATTATWEFVDRSHTNKIESFWSYARHRLEQFYGVPKHTFYLYLKEAKF